METASRIYKIQGCKATTILSTVLCADRWCNMTNQQLDMLSGFLFGWGFGLIMGYYFIP
jgi:hypothetical protein|tara:strand:- start:584 stop:760 length:177 start_codon:yes stop_codon:yes gene_type:complete